MRILLIILAVSAIFFATLAGYFFYQNQQFQNTGIRNQGTGNSQNPVSPSPQTQSETSEWKTFTYPPWNLTFKYPNDWYVYPDESTKNIRVQSYQKLETGGGSPSGLHLLTVRKLPFQAKNIANLIGLLPKSGDIGQYFGDSRTLTISEENSRPLNTYPYYTRNVSYTSGTDSSTETFNYLLDQKGTVIEATPGLDTKGGKDITDQILSTFEFTNPETPSAAAPSITVSRPSSWRTVDLVDVDIPTCLPPKWKAEPEWSGHIVFDRDPAYKPNVAYLGRLPYYGGSRREEYLNYRTKGEPDLKPKATVKELTINGRSVLDISIPSMPEALVFVSYGNLIEVQLATWHMVNANYAAYRQDIYTMISCIN